MRIKKLTLQSNNIECQASFFKNLLGCNVRQLENLISIKIGTSILEFVNAPVYGKYHYCFLIPCNQIEEAKEWFSNKLDLIPVEDNNFIANFESWNAQSMYFYDGEGNIAELIARHDLQNESDEYFGIHSFLSVNELGNPTSDPRSINQQLNEIIGSQHWKGDLDRFATNGDQHGLFLLPNYTIKKTWFPTQIEIKPLPYSALIVHKEKEYAITYENEIMEITPSI